MCNLGEGLVEETWEEAWEEAWEKAWKKAWKKATQEATEKNTIELAANMLRENASADFISRVTSLPVERIVEIGKMHGLL